MISLVKTANSASKRISRKSVSHTSRPHTSASNARRQHTNVLRKFAAKNVPFAKIIGKMFRQKNKNKKKIGRVPENNFKMIRRAMRLWLLPYWKIMLGAVLANVIVGMSTGALPLFIQYSIDILFDPESAVPLIAISLAVFSLLATRAIFTFVGNFLRAYVVQRMTAKVQYDLFENLIHSDYDVVSSRHSGQILTSLLNEAQQVNVMIGATPINLIRNGITLIGIFASMFIINWRLASFVSLTVPLVFLSMRFFSRRTKNSFNLMMSKTGDWGSHILEVARGMRIIKAYGTEARELNRSENKMGEVIRNGMRTQRAQMASGPAAEMLVGFGMAAIFFYVGYEGRAGNFSQGELIGFITAMLLVYQPLKATATLHASVQQGFVATQRLFARFDIKPKITSPRHLPALKMKKNYPQHRICFEGVKFKYPGSHIPALKGVNLNVHPGEMVALVGRSGGGKSTILNLLLRFYDVDEGRVQIDGQDIRKVQVASLRRKMALVLQDVFLFDDTIAANIGYAKEDASLDEIVKAAQIANAHDFIMALPKNYEARIGENGAKLSGGQRQRLAFARAALRDAPILLLDEPTSALDSESERAIQEAMQHLLKNRTVIVIAHRLSTIMNADKIFVVHEGQVVEGGTHKDLLKKNGTYAKLYKTQLSRGETSNGQNLEREKKHEKKHMV